MQFAFVHDSQAEIPSPKENPLSLHKLPLSLSLSFSLPLSQLPVPTRIQRYVTFPTLFSFFTSLFYSPLIHFPVSQIPFLHPFHFLHLNFLHKKKKKKKIRKVVTPDLVLFKPFSGAATNIYLSRHTVSSLSFSIPLLMLQFSLELYSDQITSITHAPFFFFIFFLLKLHLHIIVLRLQFLCF